MASFDCNYQNPSVFLQYSFLYTSQGYNILKRKEKKRRVVVVVK